MGGVGRRACRGGPDALPRITRAAPIAMQGGGRRCDRPEVHAGVGEGAGCGFGPVLANGIDDSSDRVGHEHRLVEHDVVLAVGGDLEHGTGYLGCDLFLGPVPHVEQLRDRPLGGPSHRVREPLPIARVGDHDGRHARQRWSRAQLGDRVLDPELDAGKVAAAGTDEIQEALVDRRVGGIERDETGDVIGVLGGEQPGHGAAHRVGGEDVRAGNVGRVEQFLELGDHVGERAGQRHRIAPTRRPVRHLDRAGPVVGADPGELGDRREHRGQRRARRQHAPLARRQPTTRFEDDRRAALATALEVHRAARRQLDEPGDVVDTHGRGGDACVPIAHAGGRGPAPRARRRTGLRSRRH